MSRRTFTKQRSTATAAAAEAAGLAWLAEPACLPLPRVVGLDGPTLTLERMDPRAPTEAAAHAFGRGLAHLHRAGAPHFGYSPAPRPDIADLALPAGVWDCAPDFLAEARIIPFVRLARDRGRLTRDQAATLEDVAAHLGDVIDGEERPARCHGDLWSGNVIWQSDGAALIDPAAQGGLREADLAMLLLFGLPFLDRVLDSYDEIYPLDEGWRGRVRLHQVHPLLVHTVLFGGGYAEAAVAAARSRDLR